MITPKSVLVYGTRDGEHLRATIRGSTVYLEGAEYTSTEMGATHLRDRFFCSVPTAIWLQVAEAIRPSELPAG